MKKNIKSEKALGALIEEVTPYIKQQAAFERDLSHYTMSNYHWGHVCASPDFYLRSIKDAFKNISEHQKDTISFLLDCARNYEFFKDLRDKGEWDKFIAEYGEMENVKHKSDAIK